nr:hypothetical protein [Streptomyces sp. SID5468]
MPVPLALPRPAAGRARRRAARRSTARRATARRATVRLLAPAAVAAAVVPLLGAADPGDRAAATLPVPHCVKALRTGDENVGYGQVVPEWLTIRQDPTPESEELGRLPRCSTVALRYRLAGGSVHGNRTWYRLSDRPGWVSGAYVRIQRPVPTA